jgi:hypothetical protein
VVTAAVLVLAVPAAPALADQTPGVGECYDLDPGAFGSAAGGPGRWPDAEPVPCSQPHTFEITGLGLLPEDADGAEAARSACTDLAVWSAVGVNRAVAGIVTDPLRVESRAFLVGTRPQAWVCGAVAVEYRGRAGAVPIPLESTVEGLSRRDARALRHCAEASGGRSALAPAVTTACTTRPRWQERTWVLWSALFDDNPGRAVLRARAAELCGQRAVASVPRAEEWISGLPLTRCHTKYP